MTDMRSMRVLGNSPSGHVDKFLRRQEHIRMNVPGGYVTFRWENSASDVGYGYLNYVPLRAGLVQVGSRPGKQDA